jgi:glucosamine--fructose-6-phosphate aminotransferase (isomerizing)
VERRAGKLEALEQAVDGAALEGKLGIGHTRWATHGAPTDANAHPHRDCTGTIALVHNGIIENHDALRAQLEARGHIFSSETDTEVAVHLIEAIARTRSCSLRDAVIEACGLLRGAFALVCASIAEPDTIVVARQEPPLIVGAPGASGLVASDIPALLPYTRTVVPLDNGQVAEVRPGSVRVFGFDGAETRPASVHIEWNVDAAERGGFEDFMLKEIFEQPAAVRNTMRGRLEDGRRVVLDDLNLDADRLAAITKVVVVACGTSFHAGMAAKHAVEHWTRIPVELDREKPPTRLPRFDSQRRWART